MLIRLLLVWIKTFHNMKLIKINNVTKILYCNSQLVVILSTILTSSTNSDGCDQVFSFFGLELIFLRVF